VNTGIVLRTVSLGDTDHWRWVNIGSYSSFAGTTYTDFDLAHYDGSTNFGSAYYLAADSHNNSDPLGRTLGRYALSDTELAPNVIINFPKMKTQSYMINTLCIKNHVGSTIGNTADRENATGARIAHVKQTGTFSEADYSTSFGNDIFWRAISDMNKILLYADKNGSMKTVRQRKYLNVVDAIQAGEKEQNNPVSYWRHCVLAGKDPVAVDAVGSRVMCYKWGLIPVIHKTASEALLPVGTDDAARIVVLGDDISQMNHVFMHYTNWDAHAISAGLDISDFTAPYITEIPPVIREGDQIRVRAKATGVYAGFIFYEVDSKWYVKKMECGAGWAWALVPARTSSYMVQVQDEYLNFSSTLPRYYSSLTNVTGYPNPFVPGSGVFTFKYLTEEATIRIYNVAGELVRTVPKPAGSSASWDGENDSGDIVASGVYVYIITNIAGEKATGKIMVIK